MPLRSRPLAAERVPEPSRTRVLLSGTAWNTAAQFAPLIVNLALTPYVIRTLGPVAFGLYLVVSSLGTFLGQFDGGIHRSAQRHFVLFAGRDDRVSSTRLLTTLLCFVAGGTSLVFGTAFLAAPTVIEFFHAPPQLFDDALFLFRVLIVGIGVALARNLFAALLAAYQRFALTSLTWIAGYAVNATGLVVVLSQGMGLRGIAYVFVAQQVFATVTIIPSAFRHLTRSGIGLLSRRETREFFSFAWKVQISGLLSLLGLQGAILIVGRFAAAQVPFFGPGATFAQQMRALPLNAIRPMQTMIGNALAGEGLGEGARQARELQKTWVVAVTVWIAVGAPAVFFGVNIWLPLEGRLPGLVACVMLVASFFALAPQVLLTLAMQLGLPGLEMRAYAISVAITLSLSLLGVSVFGAFAVAVANVLGQGASFWYLQARSRRMTAPLPSALAEVPWVAMLTATLLTTAAVGGVAYLIEAWGLPKGGLGLLLCGAAAAPVLFGYLAATIGLGRLRALTKSPRRA